MKPRGSRKKNILNIRTAISPSGVNTEFEVIEELAFMNSLHGITTDSPEGRQQKQEELQSCSLWNKNHIHRKIDKMKRQRAIYKMKEKDKTPEKQLNEVEIGNLTEKEFRIMIVKMIQDLGKRMEAKIKKM